MIYGNDHIILNYMKTLLPTLLLCGLHLFTHFADCAITPLEAWEFNDAAATDLASASNSIGTASFTQSTNTATNGAGLLVASQDTSNFFRDAANLSVPTGSTNTGTYQLEFKIASADLSSGDISGANIGFGFRDSVAAQDIFLIRLQKQGGRLYLSTRIDNVSSNLVDFGANVTTLSNLTVRCSIDLDSDQAEVFYSIDTLPESSAGTVALSATGTTWDRLRYVSNANSTDWGATDSVEIDYLRIGSGAPTPIAYDTVPLTSSMLYVQGAQFKTIDAAGMHFLRFNNTIYDSNGSVAKMSPSNAKTTSGAKLTLYTSSPTIRLHFDYDPSDENRDSQFALYQNGEFTREFYVSRTQASTIITIENLSDPLEVIRHDIALPSWSNPILTQVDIETGETLIAADRIRPKRIVFLGDSISHGTGQGSAGYKTYPFIAGEKLNAQIFNMAVGGAKISPPAADLLQHFGEVDIIWILVGYNNWQGASHDIPTITAEYESLLTTIRTHQPNAKVFCNTLIYSRNSVDAESGVTIDQARDAIAGVVNARIHAGDQKLYLIRSETFTDDSYLIFQADGVTPSTDPVHMGVAGAEMFADDVYRILKPHVFPTGATAHWDFNFNTNGNNAENRVTEDGVDEADLIFDGEITFNGKESEGLIGRAQVTGFSFGNDRSLSVEMKIKMSTISGQQRFFRMFNNATSSGIYLALQNGQLAAKLNGQSLLTGTTTIADSDWHTVAFTWNTETNRASLFLDGTLEATQLYPSEELPSTVQDIDGLTIGIIDATVDDVKLSNRALEFNTTAGASVTYSTWASGFDWQGETLTARTDNPDNDGLLNFEEFSYGGNPIANDAAQKAPQLNSTGSDLHIEFTLGRDSADVDYSLEFSNDLKDWSSVTPLNVYGSANDSVSVRISDYIQGQEAFVRVTTQ